MDACMHVARAWPPFAGSLHVLGLCPNGANMCQGVDVQDVTCTMATQFGWEKPESPEP